ncbi:hypothetical protein [Bradyrhizobium genosp. A]|uniref:hypothetical protein n=1 Tax=Bradyrhizobium genosp. A TaxID=83626 RepID=UPI003CEFCCC6
MHGGAAGSGAPFGNGNAVKHGFFTKEAVDERKFVRTVLLEAENLLRTLPARSEADRNRCEIGTQLTIPGTESNPPHLTNDSK